MAQARLMRLAIAVLIAATLLSLPLRPLWVDEIYQLEATRDLPIGQVLHSSMLAPGGMPFGYLTQALWLKFAGFSATQARIPAALFGLGSLLATAWIARQLCLNAAFATILGLLTPLLFRYSTEARPYSQGLFFSTLSTALFLSWLNEPSRAKWFGYLVCIVAGIYSQPFAIFTPVAHAAYLLFQNRPRLLPIVTAIALAGAAYAPWFVLSQRALHDVAWLKQMFFSWHQVSPLVIMKEISGGGYVCSVSLLLLVALGVKRHLPPLLFFCIVVPAALAIAADARFNYFFAIRQLIFVVPPLLLLATAALKVLWNEQKKSITVLAGIYIASALVKDVNWQRDRNENWAKAAAVIKDHLQATHGCVIFQPSRDAHAYYFFEPTLRLQTCGESSRTGQTLLAVSPYAAAAQRQLVPRAENVGNTLISVPSK